MKTYVSPTIHNYGKLSTLIQRGKGLILDHKSLLKRTKLKK